MKQSMGQGDIVSKDMLGDKRHQGLGVKGSVQVEEALRSLNWRNFLLFILVSTGGLNTKWLLHMWMLW